MKTLTLHSQLQEYFIKSIILSEDDYNLYEAEDFKVDKMIVLAEYNVSKQDLFNRLLRFKHTNINTVYKIFQENNKIYTVSELLTSQRLEMYLSKNTFRESEINIILDSMLDMLIQLKDKNLSLSIKIEDFRVDKNKNIILDNTLNIIHYINDEKIIFELGRLIFFLMRKSIYKEDNELKENEKYSKALCGLVNRMIGIKSTKQFKDLSPLKSLVKKSTPYAQINCEPTVCSEESRSFFSKFLSFIALILVIMSGIYLLTYEKKILKINDINFLESIQYHIAGYIGKSEAQYALGRMYENGYGVEKNINDSLNWYKKSANSDNILAQLYLAKMYEDEKLKIKDMKQAIYWYTKSAQNGNEIAQFNLGSIYYDRESPLESIKWLEMAAAQNYKHSYYLLGLVYLNITGKAIDYKKAFAYFSKGTAANDKYSEMLTAYMYDNGYGVEKDTTKAFTLYTKAALAGYEMAQMNLAHKYYFGLDMKIDKDKAKYWYKKAAEQGNTTAQEHLIQLKQKPTIKQKKNLKTKKVYKLPITDVKPIIYDEEKVCRAKKYKLWSFYR